jgi:signal transduction histidine kinase
MDEKPSNAPTDQPACNCFISGCWNSIRTHLIVLLTAVVTIVYGVVAFVEIADELDQANLDLHEQVDLLSAVQADALSVPLWNFDQDEVERQLNVLIVNRDIVSASVLDGRGQIIAEASIAGIDDLPANHAHVGHDHHGSDAVEGPPHLVEMMFPAGQHRFHLVSHDITNGDREVIGKLQVVMTHDHLSAVQESKFWSHLKQFLIITIVVAVTIGVAVTSLVRPVLNITEAMDKVAAGDLGVVIPATERRDEIGKMARALEVFKANAEQLQTSLDRERELNGLQRQFVSMVSHEFRTPLSVIDGHAQRMLRRFEKLSPDRLRDGLSKVRQSVIRLTELMESVLNSARLEEGRIEFNPEPCSLIDILTELHGSYAEINNDRDIILDVNQLPNGTFADPKLLRQVFSNLLSNACKYSGPGSHVWIEGHPDGANGVAVSIRDEGVGIPADELQKLFDRFFRASTSTGIAGTGIGLHLVRHFVDMHQGRISVSSEVDKGTTFTVHLPNVALQTDALTDAA